MPIPIDLAWTDGSLEAKSSIIDSHLLRATSSSSNMDTPLSGERLGEEKAFARRYLQELGNRPLNYASDYSPPLSTRPRKLGVVQTEVRPPPEAMDVDAPQGDFLHV